MHKIIALFMLCWLPGCYALDINNIYIPPASDAEYPPDVAFMILDLKYRPGALKVCEFGQGVLSGFVGHDMLYGPGAVYERLWEFLTSLRLPILMVRPSCRTEHSLFNDSGCKHLDIGRFARKVDQCIPTFASVFPDPVKSELAGIPKRLAEAKALAVPCRFGDFLKAYDAIGGFATGMIALDYVARQFTLNKGLTHALFANDPVVERYRPKALILPRSYRPTMAEEIQSQLGADAYVIKPLNAWRGEGILMATKHELDKVLKHALMPGQGRYDHWARTRNSNFIVEVLEHSMPIMVHQRPYDPTMRVILGLAYDAGQVTMRILGAYWKMPHHPSTSIASLEERYVSHIVPGNAFSSAVVAPAILAKVEQEISQFMPYVYRKMIALKHEKKLLNKLHRFLWSKGKPPMCGLSECENNEGLDAGGR